MHLLAFVPGSPFDKIANSPIYATTFVIVLVVGLVIGVLFALTLRNTLKMISPENRRIEPGKVWWAVIPYVGAVYIFYVVKKMSESIQMESLMRNIVVPSRPTYIMGMCYTITGISFTVVDFIGNFIEMPSLVKTVSGIVSLACMVFWILYWVQVNEYKKKFKMPSFNDSIIFGSAAEKQ